MACFFKGNYITAYFYLFGKYESKTRHHAANNRILHWYGRGHIQHPALERHELSVISFSLMAVGGVVLLYKIITYFKVRYYMNH
ncbi:hypothetical protein DCM91_13255 [Chitinophaga costaii]|nr:hypothetical protein DCM91_13255 [Chitinophaga costaii]